MDTEVSTPDCRRPFITITLLFFLWGFITVMNDVLIPYLKGEFELSYFQAGLVQFAFFGAFFFVSLIYYVYIAFYGFVGHQVKPEQLV